MGQGRTRRGIALGAWPLAPLLLLAAGCAGEAAAGRPWVEAIRFHGNRHVGAGEIRGRIQVEETSWLPFTSKKYLDPLALEVDRKRIEALYRAHGFFSARVTEVRVTRRGGAADVDITIDEGPRTNVTAVEVTGVGALDEKRRSRLIRELPLRAGQPFQHERYLETRALLQARLRRQGHAWAKVSGRVLVDRDAHTARVELTAEPGPLVRFGGVTVRGGGKDEKAIVERSGMRPGRPFDPEALETARNRLQATERFARVQVREVPHPGDPGVADVEIDVAPGPRNDVKVGVGLGVDSDRQEVHLPIRYSRYGFLGGLRTLSLRARPAYVALPSLLDRQRDGPALRFDATLTQPDFLARDLTLRLQVGYDLGVDYAFKFHGPRGQVAADYSLLRDHLTVGVSYDFQYLFFWDLAAGDVFNNPDLARSFLGYTNPYRVAWLVEQLTLDYRDNVIDPHRGVWLRLAFEEGASVIGSDFNYEKIMPDVRAYLPLHRRVVLSGRVVYGRLFTQDPASPITRRFYAGGAESHRGFSYNRLSPQVPSNTTSFTIPVGGDRLFLAQLEMRGDVVRLAGNWLGLAAFCDAGDVPDRGRSLDLTQLHVAVGPGLRYRTIIGVIRVDLGIRLNRLSPTQADGRQNPDPGSRFAFHISVGEPF